MAARHPERAIIPYLRGDLEDAERNRVAGHLAACPECRAASESFRELLGDLAASRPPPPVDWARYRAELRTRLEARTQPRRWSWWQPVPLVASAALAGVLIFLAVGDLHHPKPVDLSALEEALLGHRLEIAQQHALLERLDLLEDLDVIRNLGPLAINQEG